MGFIDLITLILDNLGRRKARVALTAVGVIIGTAAVVVLVSLAIGLQKNATQQLYGIGDLTQIQVYPNYQDSGQGVAVAQKVGGGGGGGDVPSVQTLITDETITQLAAIPGVSSVIPRDYIQGAAILKYNRLEAYTGMIGIGAEDLSYLGVELQGGEDTLNPGTAVIGSMIPNTFYNPQWRPGQEMPTPPDLLGQTIKLVFIEI